MQIWTGNQKNCHLQWNRLFKESGWRPTKTADFRSSFWQIIHVSHVPLLEDKIQDWDVFLFTIIYGSFAVDQRNWDGWISGWSKFFVFYQVNSRTRFRHTWRENCFSTEQNHPFYPLQEKSQSGGKEKLKKKFGFFVENKSLTWSTSISLSLEPMILSRIMLPYLLLPFEMTTWMKFTVNDENPIW